MEQDAGYLRHIERVSTVRSLKLTLVSSDIVKMITVK